MADMDMCMTSCPDCHEMKMGPKSMMPKMMTCDGCGGKMKEMVMK